MKKLKNTAASPEAAHELHRELDIMKCELWLAQRSILKVLALLGPRLQSISMLGSGCSIAVEHTPHEREVVGSLANHGRLRLELGSFL